MSGIILRLPLPPSSNHRLLIRNGRAILAPEHRAWMRDAVRAVAAQLPRGWMPYTGPVAMLVEARVPGLSSDVSNRLKSLEDALTESGVWLDDRQVVLIHASKGYALRGQSPDVVVTVEPREDAETWERLAESERRAAKAQAKPRRKPNHKVSLNGSSVAPTPNVRRAR